MQIRLRKFYFRILLPPVAGLAVLLALRAGHLIQPVDLDRGRQLAPWLFLLAIVLAVAAPVYLRASFAHRMRKAHQTPSSDFYGFQRRLIGISLASVYLLPVIGLVQLSQFYQSGVVLAALYAIYYQYPSLRRLAFDRRLFRVLP
ncbi:conserved membrane hypothetical protein [Desulfosarcina cetonica]|uniref:hypothetical protein n=1 Tax=Desulfosarcina cetonica TaxID=90730 RepID=UPI0006D1960E|nr:hypothetical protein [Desulfosarcina cetonica]VTR66490.1 conserved membrane hypothetical protein [Desulfosarcina cetonica]